MTRHFPAYAHAAAHPNARAVSVDGQHLTWAELISRSAPLQVCWTDALKDQDRVMLVAHRTLRFVEHFTALIRAGVEVLLLDPDATNDERGRIQSLSGASRILDQEDWDVIEAHAATCDNEPADAVPWDADRILFTVMTSGTTGDPRPIDVRCEQVIFSTLGSAARLGSLPNDRWHAPLPLHHVGGIMVFLRALILGFEAEYTSTFDAAYSAERLASGEVTLASFVPVMLTRILEHAPELRTPDTLRAILLGGAATPDALLKQSAACGLPIARSWGMSETTSQIATAPPGDFESLLSPLPFAKITTHDGILHIDAPQAQDGTFQTTDRGFVHDGRVEVHGRADDLFISGGENIAPLEIERVLLEHPTVREALVFGAPSEQWGHIVAAFIVADATIDERAIDDATLRAWCAKTLSRHKIPKLFYFVRNIPRNPLGKPSRIRALSLHNSMIRQNNGASSHSSSGAIS